MFWSPVLNLHIVMQMSTIPWHVVGSAPTLKQCVIYFPFEGKGGVDLPRLNYRKHATCRCAWINIDQAKLPVTVHLCKQPARMLM